MTNPVATIAPKITFHGSVLYKFFKTFEKNLFLDKNMLILYWGKYQKIELFTEISIKKK